METPRNMNDSTMFWETGGGGSGGGSGGGGGGGVSGGNRRRKKRPSYGVRTVEITKGHNGFGFTISGQAPCILSKIVQGSSAERSGLRMGDYLIAVNGQNVRKSTHDKVVKMIGRSKLVKLQIAENYYTDSSGDEFVTANRQNKFPNRLRHKQQQTRAERVVRDLQSGAIFSERAAIQLGEAALLSDRDWPESCPSKPPNTYTPTCSMSPTAGMVGESQPQQQSPPPQSPPQCASPTRRRFMPLVFAERELRQNTSGTPTRHFEEAAEQLSRARLSPAKMDKTPKNKMHLLNMQNQFQQQQQQQKYQMQQQIKQQIQQHTHQQLRHNLQSTSYQQCHPHQHSQTTQPFPPKQQHQHHQHQQHFQPSPQQQQQQLQQHMSYHQHHSHHHGQLDNEEYQQQQRLQLQQHQQQQQHNQKQVYDQQYLQQQLLLRQHHQLHSTNAGNGREDVRIITEQEINKILYPTLVELQQQGPPPDLGESLYRAVVGYLGTIEVPKDSQGGSRLAAIKNCIRRLRIEKKVHTLVLMSVFTERVVLTNPHGITLAQYPAERITFCGVYADDKKFFGLVTVHGCSSDELSDVSQDGRCNERNEQSISSSCHVFMVDPSMVQHDNHSRRAKTFRIECTPADDDSPNTHCREFPECAEPILQTIMGLYRSQPGFNFDNGANNPGLPDDVQMSPQHSNTSSNSSNSDSGIGFRDEGGSHLYRHVDRVFVVEVDDNQRMRIQNYHLVGNGRSNSNNNNQCANINSNNNSSTNANPRSNNHLENLQANLDNLRSNNSFSLPIASSSLNGSLGNGLLLGESSDSANRTGNSNTNPRTNSAERNASSSSKGNYRAMNTGDRLRVNKCDQKCAKTILDSSIGVVGPKENLRVSVTDTSCDRDSLVVNCGLEDDKGMDMSACLAQSSNMTDYLKAGLSDSNSNRRRRSDSRAGASEAGVLDGRSSITDELRASLLMAGRGETRSSLAAAVDGRTSVTEDKRNMLSGNRTPAAECSSPSDIERLTVRAMPDPVSIERTPPIVNEIPPHVNSMRHSMHKYLQHKQQHLVKVSQKINRRESDTDGIHPLSVRAFSPANAKKKSITPTPSVPTQNSLDLELSLKLSPKVYGLPIACLTSSTRNNPPSERSFSRSLEDLRDSSTSDGIVGSIGAQGGSFRDGSESDQGLERLRQCPLQSRLPMPRYLHASETNLSSYNTPHGHSSSHYSQEAPRGAFRAVPCRAPPRPPSEVAGPSRLSGGIRACGIASIDQIISGVTRMGPSRSTVDGKQSLLGSHFSRISPSLMGTNSVMGPPNTSTVLKGVLDQQTSKSAHTHLRGLSDHPHGLHGADYPTSNRSQLYDQSIGSPLEYHDDIQLTTQHVHTQIINSNSNMLNLPTKRDSLISVQNSAECVFPNNGDNEESKNKEDDEPSVQEYVLDSDFDDDQGEGVGAADKKWTRKNSLPRHLQRARRDHLQQDAGGASDNEARGSGDSSEHSPSEGGAGDRVQGWAASFERLIDDPAGLHTFAVFLKKEYSYENISFWAACERYRQGIDSDTAAATDTSTKNTAANITNNNNSCCSSSWSQWAGRHAAAAAIYNTHLGNNASEPVNVDSQARSLAQEGLRQPTQDLFALAQKQVYNLMKFDSYSRFLKSPQYQECLEREARGEGLLYDGGDSLDASLRIHHPLPHNSTTGAAATAGGSNSNFGKGKSEMEERRRRSLLPWHRSKDRSKSKDRLADASSARPATGGKRVLTGPSVSDSSTAAANRDSNSIGKAKGLSVSAGRLARGISGSGEMPPRSNSATRSSGSRHPSDSSGSLGRASEVSGSKTSLNSGSEGVLLMGGRKALSKESLTSSECLSLSGGEGGSSSAGGSGVTGRCRVVLPDRSQSVVAVRSGVSIERVMRRLLDRRGLPFLAFNVLQGKSEKPVALAEDSSVLCSAEVRLQQLVLFRLDLPNQKTVCVKAKPHKTASDVLRPILAKYGFKLDLMHIHTVDDPRPINVKGPITELDGQKFIIQTKEDVKEWGVSVLGNGRGTNVGAPGGSVGGNHTSADALDAITNRVFEDLLHSKTSHQLFNSCDYDARSTKTDQGSEHSGGVRTALGRHSALADKCARLRGDGDLRGVRAAPAMTPAKDNDDLYEGLKRAQMSRIEDQRGTEINSELPDFLKCDSEGDKNLVDMVNEEVLAKCFPEGLPFLSSDDALPSYCGGQQTPLTDQQPQQHFYPNHHHHHCQTSSQQQPQLIGAARLGVAEEHQQQHHLPHTTVPSATSHHHHQQQPQQHSSSSLAQHQALHNFWSDISGGGSSMPSSLLATSSSSLSSSTGLPMSSSHPFDGVDIPLTVAKSLLDMQYHIPDQTRVAARLRPRPESCVTTQTEMMATRPEQANRPKSSCGALTVNNSSHSSPNRTLLASPDLDATLLPSCVLDGHEDRRRTDTGAYGEGGNSAAAAAVEEVCRVMRMQSPTRHAAQQQQHMHHYHHHRHQHHHLHLHQSTMDALMPESLTSSNMNAAMTTGNGGSDFNINGMLDARSNNNKYSSTATYGQRATNFSTPPPPLPPKPKLGVPPRGPPPRPPSRQLQLAPLPAAQCPPSSGTNYYTVGLHTTSDGGEAGKKERCGEATKLASAKDQDAISFV